MNSKNQPLSGKNRMFNSIVLMGGGLALGCGGVAKVDASGAAGSSATSHGGSSAGGATSAGGTEVVSAGGNLIVPPLGGAPGYAGAIGVGGTLSVAGSPSTGGVAGGGFVSPLPCEPAQWTCAVEQKNCSFNGGFQLGSGCSCDPSRPAHASDCVPGLSFVCIQATQDAQGNALAGVVPYECSCLPTPQSCYPACDAAYGAARFACYYADYSAPGNASGSPILCYCNVQIVLK